MPACSGGFVDTFRLFFPKRKRAYTCWNMKTGARLTNYGTRLDLILANADFARGIFSHCDIAPKMQVPIQVRRGYASAPPLSRVESLSHWMCNWINPPTMETVLCIEFPLPRHA